MKLISIMPTTDGVFHLVIAGEKGLDRSVSFQSIGTSDAPRVAPHEYEWTIIFDEAGAGTEAHTQLEATHRARVFVEDTTHLTNFEGVAVVRKVDSTTTTLCVVKRHTITSADFGEQEMSE